MLNRRGLLQASSFGFGMLALKGLMAEEVMKNNKRVIFMYMNGGMTHTDTFDYKPLMVEKDGIDDPISKGRKIVKPAVPLTPAGKSGIEISENFPHLRKHADSLCLLNGMKSKTGNHNQARSLLHTGNFQFSRPSMGSWLLYGLGTENKELPGFITIDANIGPDNYGSSFLPAVYQGTAINAGSKSPIPNLKSPIALEKQRENLDFLRDLNNHQLANSENSRLEGLIESYELAFRMQTSVPNTIDISKESQETLQKYGINDKATAKFGKQCLLAKKFSEAGVRFVEIGHGGWDMHQNINDNLKKNTNAIDKPIAALIQDLKDSGLFEDTIILFGSEFGRTPGIKEGATGRDHNNGGFSMWMAGGGVKGGIRHGSTDDFGHKAVDSMDMHDLHATILHLMGIDHSKLTYRYSGRDFRLTDVFGNIQYDIIS
tara:strand:- start:98 stop:1387 length:1290 start_codon:yes stop_codon:yes gene_type:complete